MAGKDIHRDLTVIRQDIGICPQHNCLFPLLTVREHVQFFSRLKGLYSKVPKKEAEEQIDQSIRDVALFEKRNTFSKDLSGGMMRKLSVAIAFCGGSKNVFLDEPVRLVSMWFQLCVCGSSHSIPLSLGRCRRPAWTHSRADSHGTSFETTRRIESSFLPRTSWMKPTFLAIGSQSWLKVSFDAPVAHSFSKSFMGWAIS